MKEFDLPLLKVTSTELISGVSGESEENIRALFDKAIVGFVFRLYWPVFIKNPQNVTVEIEAKFALHFVH